MQIHPMMSCHKRVQHTYDFPWIATHQSNDGGGGLPRSNDGGSCRGSLGSGLPRRCSLDCQQQSNDVGGGLLCCRAMTGRGCNDRVSCNDTTVFPGLPRYARNNRAGCIVLLAMRCHFVARGCITSAQSGAIVGHRLDSVGILRYDGLKFYSRYGFDRGRAIALY
jgi:hypothetical protein